MIRFQDKASSLNKHCPRAGEKHIKVTAAANIKATAGALKVIASGRGRGSAAVLLCLGSIRLQVNYKQMLPKQSRTAVAGCASAFKAAIGCCARGARSCACPSKPIAAWKSP